MSWLAGQNKWPMYHAIKMQCICCFLAGWSYCFYSITVFMGRSITLLRVAIIQFFFHFYSSLRNTPKSIIWRYRTDVLPGGFLTTNLLILLIQEEDNYLNAMYPPHYHCYSWTELVVVRIWSNCLWEWYWTLAILLLIQYEKVFCYINTLLVAWCQVMWPSLYYWCTQARIH